MRLLWLTDVHLNFLPGGSMVFPVEPWFDAVLVTGDIAEATSLRELFGDFAKDLAVPVYFVLGNHDFYKGSFGAVYGIAREMAATIPNLCWLDEAEPVLLDDQTALAGNQGWFDGVLGDPNWSMVVMSDFELIDDLAVAYEPHRWVSGDRKKLLAKLRALGRRHARAAQPKLLAALALRRDVIFATHFPPFEGATWHAGKQSDNDWLPWFSCAAMGEMLDTVAAAHPHNRILVLCGHTHGEGVYYRAPNLRVLTGKARYGVPQVAGFFPKPFDGWGP
jgi:predicted phosphohydrolase